MRTFFALLAVVMFSLVVSCATTEYKRYEADDNMFKGKGGTKIMVNGMELWDNGDPLRKFRVLGIIDDQRSGGIIPMSQLRNERVRKAREAGGDVVVQLSNQSQLAGSYRSGSASVSSAMPFRRNIASLQSSSIRINRFQTVDTAHCPQSAICE
jgi:hypothetical protein